MSRIIRAPFANEIEPKVIEYKSTLPLQNLTDKNEEEFDPEHMQTQQEEQMFDDLVNLEKMKKETLIWKETLIQQTTADLARKKSDIENYVQQQTIEAKMERTRILDEAMEEAERMRNEAYAEGMSRGKKEGVEKVERECSSYLAEAKAAVVGAFQERNKIINDTEEEIISLALEIAKKIVKKEIEVSPEVVQRIVNEAINKVTHREKITIRVNLNDKPRIDKDRSLLREKSSCKDLIILSDPTVLEGGCVIETDLGTVDARIETQIDQIEESLLRLVEMNKETTA